MQQGSFFAPSAKVAGSIKKFRQSLERMYGTAVKSMGGPNFYLFTEGQTFEFTVDSRWLSFEYSLPDPRPEAEADWEAVAKVVGKIFMTAKKYGFTHGFISAQPDNYAAPGKRESEVAADLQGPAAMVDWYNYTDSDVIVAFALAMERGKEDFLRDMAGTLKGQKYFWWLMSPDHPAAAVRAGTELA